MTQVFKINDFEGPLDLLLHLIKENKMDIMDFEITTIINQYLQLIDDAKNINLEVASEFLVMASSLIEIKSKLLLPKPEIDIDVEYEEDSQEILVQRLLEYKRYKDVSTLLKDYNEQRTLIFTRPVADMSKYTTSEQSINIPDNLSLYDLIKSIDKMMKRVEKTKPITSIMENNEISIEQRSNTLMQQIKSINKEKISFIELIDVNNKSYIIVTFLSLLDLAKKNIITIIQDQVLDEIYISEVA